MSEKIKKILLIITCVVFLIGHTIWYWPKYCEDLKQPWIDRWEEQMK